MCSRIAFGGILYRSPEIEKKEKSEFVTKTQALKSLAYIFFLSHISIHWGVPISRGAHRTVTGYGCNMSGEYGSRLGGYGHGCW